MRIAATALLAAAVCALPACNKQPSVDLKNVTPLEVSKAMKDSGANRALVRPGKWSSTVTIAAINTSQLPPDLAAKINEQVGKARTIEACLTPQQVDHPEQMLGQAASGCRYEHYTMGSGKIDGRMICASAAGKTEMNVAGTYGNDRYAMTVATKSSGAGGASGDPSGSSTMKIESHRLGDCDAKQKG